MDDLFPLLLFLLFILAPLIEQIRKKGRPPTQRPPMQRPPAQRPLPGPPPARRSETEEVSSKGADSASGMIPDDLWQILTGERRPTTAQPVPSQQRPQPWDVVYVPPEEAEADEEALVRDDVNVETRRTSREIENYDEIRRRPAPQTLEEAPVIVSLEQEMLPAEARHTAFHERLAAQPVPAARTTPSRKAADIALRLDDPNEIRRAFILQEVLGRPRGLD